MKAQHLSLASIINPTDRLVATKNTTIKIRVDAEELAAWKTSAESFGLTLSELIRRRMGVGLDTPNPFYKVLAELEPAALKKAGWETDRKPCKHGLLFCKKCK